jgi:hypothetical protein
MLPPTRSSKGKFRAAKHAGAKGRIRCTVGDVKVGSPASKGLKVAFREGHIKMAREPSYFPAALIGRIAVADLLKR